MQKKRTVSAQRDDGQQLNGITGTQSDNTEERVSGADDSDNTGNKEGKETESDSTGDSTDEEQSSGTGTDSGDENRETKSNSAGKILTAVYPILYLSRQYKVGEALPANDPAMAEAWIAAGTAVWIPAPSSDTGEGQGARPMTEEPGQAISVEAI